MISALKIFTLTLMAVLTIGITTSFTFVEASEERPDAYAQWGPTSEFTTTGIATVQVTDHYMNMNPNTVETLTVDVYTERNEDNPELTITLTESDADTGLFLAAVYFSEIKTSSGNTLQVVDGDIVSVEYTYSQVPGSDKHEDKIGVGQEKTISNSPKSPVTGSTVSPIVKRPDAYPEWGADVYTSADTAVARVVDPFMNAEPNKIETLTASIVVADDYDNGIKITLTETGANTGIFEETISFTETEESSGNMIKVTEGDDVSLDYLYSEVPDSDKREDMIEVGDEMTIQNSSAPSVTLDRTVYPVPFGGINDFEESESFFPDGRSIFPVHASAIVAGEIQKSKTLATGDLMLHIRVNDANFDASSQKEDKINKDILGKTVGPLKISVSRGSQTMVLAYAGGSTPNDDGLIDVGSNNPATARQIGSISEVSPDSGIFELDLVVRYTDGPFSTKCPVTATFTSLDDDASFGTEESRFDESSAEKENYCILQGDVLTVEYTSIDKSGNVNITTDSATFDLRNGVLEADKSVYIIGSDMILTLTDPDLDLDNDKVETYPLDLIEWDSDAATLTMGKFGGEISAFDPEPLQFRETGDSTGIFQIVIEIPKALKDDSLERGEEIILEHTDWGPSGAYHVGDEDEDINLTIYTSNFGATVELDKKMYDWNDKVYITVKSPDHNFDSDLIDEIGNNDFYPLKVSTRNFDLDNYKLIETGTNTGIFTGEVKLVGYAGNPNNISTGKGPTDGMISASGDDGITVAFEFSEDETVVGSALVQSDRELPPLKQQSAGVPPNDVVCNDGFSKIYKSDDSVSCVTLETREQLIERGWNEF